MSNSIEDITRFWSKVQKHKNCCWIWRACKDKDGYGLYRFKGRMGHAHRVAYYLTYKVAPGKLCVLHKCDNPQCVRPDHLFLGTKKDNKQDSMRKGRQRGGRPPRLTPKEVRSIRKLFLSGNTQRKIAIKYKIHPSMVSLIVNRINHKSIL